MRLFIALTVPERVTERLTREQRRLDAMDLPFRWVKQDAMHVTLVFLGETPEERLPAIRGAIDEAALTATPLTLRADGVGTFPPRGVPRVVWAGLTGDRTGLTALHAALVAALRQREVTFEARDYAPHVTLGRVGGRVSPDAVARLRRTDAYRIRDFGAWTADAIHLIRSELRPDGARYTTLYTSALRG